MMSVFLMLLAVLVGLFLLFLFRQKSDILKLVLIIATFSVARVFFASGWKSLTGQITSIKPSAFFYFLLLANFFILSVLFILAVNHLTKRTFASLGWTSRAIIKNTLIGLIFGTCFFLLLTFNKPLKLQNLFPAAFFSFLIASWQEENIFRGYLMGYFTRRFDIEQAIIYQALVYSLAHMGFYLFLPISSLILSLIFAFILGLLFGYLRIKTKSQVPAFVAHTIIDVAFLIT
jgi:membrane protease YdiL (CAAX protease family)